MASFDEIFREETKVEREQEAEDYWRTTRKWKVFTFSGGCEPVVPVRLRRYSPLISNSPGMAAVLKARLVRFLENLKPVSSCRNAGINDGSE
jgi:hypothetical protein